MFLNPPVPTYICAIVKFWRGISCILLKISRAISKFILKICIDAVPVLYWHQVLTFMNTSVQPNYTLTWSAIGPLLIHSDVCMFNNKPTAGYGFYLFITAVLLCKVSLSLLAKCHYRLAKMCQYTAQKLEISLVPRPQTATQNWVLVVWECD